MSKQPYVLERYKDSNAILSELDVLGYDFCPVTIPRLQAHVHRNAYEICYIRKGQVNWWVESDVYRVNKGELFITRPGEEHGGVDAMMHTCELYFIQIVFPERGEIPGLQKPQTSSLAKGYSGLRRRCFSASAIVSGCFEKLIHEHRQPVPFSEVAARAVLHELLICVLRDHDTAVADRGTDKSDLVRDALRWIDVHLDEDWRVEDIAAAVGLGVSRFHERFLDEVGFSPSDYRTRRRIENAKLMLQTANIPIIDIAMRLGFSTSQYFATVFRKQTGMSPRAYRQLMRDTASELE